MHHCIKLKDYNIIIYDIICWINKSQCKLSDIDNIYKKIKVVNKNIELLQEYLDFINHNDIKQYNSLVYFKSNIAQFLIGKTRN